MEARGFGGRYEVGRRDNVAYQTNGLASNQQCRETKETTVRKPRKRREREKTAIGSRGGGSKGSRTGRLARGRPERRRGGRVKVSPGCDGGQGANDEMVRLDGRLGGSRSGQRLCRCTRPGSGDLKQRVSCRERGLDETQHVYLNDLVARPAASATGWPVSKWRLFEDGRL